ncbi:MAG: SUMF1/EgtB/PvdO family nonheme iron enzyme [Polyangiaceae bacterium]|nr:SUMF1/EgtB/PvdO family nonheme iron enzyme [Polyangiaceae bacterium]
MRNRILATASTLGLLLNGLVLARAGVFAGPIASAGKVVTVAGNVAAVMMVPRTATAATASLHAELAPEGETVVAAHEPTVMPIPNQTPAPGAGTRVLEATGGSCPAGMVFVEGDYCPDVRHECKHWLEETGKFAYFRCEEYTKATCLSKERQHKRFCIDRDEYVPKGEKLPVSHQSWTHATRTCEAEGKRVCRESEWQFACEGEEMRPYPYGWRRDPDACNADLTDIYRPDGKLRDLRVGSDDKPRCVSPFGVHNLTGNLEEWTTIDVSADTAAPRPAMKGAYWQPSRNHCRAAQTAHDRFYKGTETGFRCCSDVE